MCIRDSDGTEVFRVQDNKYLDIVHDGSTLGLALNGTLVTSTAAELNILDGVTATATELNLIDGVTATTAELNILDGVTASTAEINIIDGVTATTAELNIMDGVTATTAEINLIDGGTARGTTAVASGDGFLHNDGGTMRMTNISSLATRLAGSGLSASDGVLSTSGGGGGSSLTVGSDNQIPFSNAAGDDLEYGADFTFDGTTLNVGSGNGGTENLTVNGTRSTITIGNSTSNIGTAYQIYDSDDGGSNNTLRTGSNTDQVVVESFVVELNPFTGNVTNVIGTSKTMNHAGGIYYGSTSL